MIKQERYITGDPDYDVVGIFFAPIIEKFNLSTNNAIIEYKTYKNTDNAMVHLVVNDRLKACVISRRTDFNNIEYTFIEI
jgi:hypothetical protein